MGTTIVVNIIMFNEFSRWTIKKYTRCYLALGTLISIVRHLKIAANSRECTE